METIGYTQDAKQKLESLNQQLKEYISENYIHGEIGTSYWTISHKGNRQPADISETEAHQRHIRLLKQQMQNISQDSLYEIFQDSNVVAFNKNNTVEGLVTEKDYWKIFPLVMRRKNMDFVFSNILKSLKVYDSIDGELFSFSEPVDIKVDYLFCDCGQFPLPLEEMMEHEIQLATEHLKVCQHIRTVSTTEKSVVMKHTIGRWDCKACYKSPGTKENPNSEVESTEWCPRFLRPFRTNTSQQYANILRLDHPGQKSCYGGILHKQISVEQDGDKSFIVKEERCDTCGYSNTDKKELITKQLPNYGIEDIRKQASIQALHYAEFASWPKDDFKDTPKRMAKKEITENLISQERESNDQDNN